MPIIATPATSWISDPDADALAGSRASLALCGAAVTEPERLGHEDPRGEPDEGADHGDGHEPHDHARRAGQERRPRRPRRGRAPRRQHRGGDRRPRSRSPHHADHDPAAGRGVRGAHATAAPTISSRPGSTGTRTPMSPTSITSASTTSRPLTVAGYGRALRRRSPPGRYAARHASRPFVRTAADGAPAPAPLASRRTRRRSPRTAATRTYVATRAGATPAPTDVRAAIEEMAARAPGDPGGWVQLSVEERETGG